MKLNGNHLLVADILKLHKYQTFDLMKMHNMSKIWFPNNKFNLLRWNRIFFMIFQGLSVARSCLRPEAAPLAAPLTLLLCLKEEFWVILQKLLGAAILWDTVAQIWSFQLLLNCKSSSLSLPSLKNMLKVSILDLTKRGYFFQILLYF